MNVSTDVKNAYISDESNKELQLYLPNMDMQISGAKILHESMKLKESIFDGDSIEFVGCISSMFRIQVHEFNKNIKGEKITVTICTDGTEYIPLFKGIVDTVHMQTNKQFKEIVAYDELYTKGNINVASWYNALPFPVTIKFMRDSLFDFIGITQEEKTLPNDEVIINKEYEPASLQALTVIKAICQINGAFGIINRDGKFEYRILPEITYGNGTYPSLTLFPPFYPGAGVPGYDEYIPQAVPYYKKVDYEEYNVKPVDKLTIRQTENDVGVTYGTGANNYIIQGNMFTYGKSDAELLQIAKNIYPNVQGISYTPFNAVNNGYPWVECGKDIVSYVAYDFEESAKQGTDVYVDKEFYVFSRTLSGIQALRDEYSAEGEEYQREFVSDLQAQIENIKQNVQQEVSNGISKAIEEGKVSTLKVVSTDTIPAPEDQEPNTIYFKRVVE